MSTIVSYKINSPNKIDIVCTNATYTIYSCDRITFDQDLNTIIGQKLHDLHPLESNSNKYYYEIVSKNANNKPTIIILMSSSYISD